MSFFSAGFFKPKYFAAHYFNVSGSPEDQERSGYWRLNLYKLQEESERKRKEKHDAIIAEAVSKALGPVKVPKKQVKPVTRKPDAPRRIDREPDVKPKPLYRPDADVGDNTLPLLVQVWTIMRETYLLTFDALPVRQMLLAKIEAANDEEDIELLLMAA